MRVDRQEIAEELKDIETEIQGENIEQARKKVRELRKRFDVADVTISQGDQTIGVKVDIWSYEYEDSIYFVTSDHTSIIDAVSDLVANHIPKLANPGARHKTAEATAESIRNADYVVSATSYEQIRLDDEISIHTDVYYMRASIDYKGEVIRNIGNPDSEKIIEAAKKVVESAKNE